MNDVTLDIEIDASLKVVWDLLADVGWWIGEGTELGERVDTNVDVFTHPERGRFRIRSEEYQPRRYLTWRCLADGDCPTTLVEVFVVRRRPGGSRTKATVVRVVERGLLTPHQRERSLCDWEQRLHLLQVTAQAGHTWPWLDDGRHVVRAAGVTKPTLYAHFRSKSELVAAVLHRRHEDRRAELEVLLAPLPAAEHPMAVLDWLETFYAERGERGCGFLNAAAELTDRDAAARAVVQREKAWLRDVLIEGCAAAGLRQPTACRLPAAAVDRWRGRAGGRGRSQGRADRFGRGAAGSRRAAVGKPVSRSRLSDRPLTRSVRLLTGLVFFGLALALLVQARLGLDPWTVFSAGVARHLDLTLGEVTVASSGVVMLLWIPLRQRPGIGTVANALVVGPVLDLGVALLPSPQLLVIRWLFLVLGLVLVAVGTGLYVGVGWGPGPRDGLMTGLVQLGAPLYVARMLIEGSVLVIGWLLGGTVGAATVVFALAVGPMVARALPRLTLPPSAAPGDPADHR